MARNDVSPFAAVVITGKERIELFQLQQQRFALKLEILGLKYSRGSVYAHVKRQLGFKGSKESVLTQLEAHIAQKEKEAGL